MHPLKGPLQLLGACNVIDAVQAADAGVDGPVQIQLVHGLVEKKGRDLRCLPALFGGLSQHFLRLVHPDHLIPPPGQLQGQAAGTAGQVQHRMDGQGAAGKVALQIVCPADVVHIPGELIVAPGQVLIRHADPSAP